MFPEGLAGIIEQIMQSLLKGDTDALARPLKKGEPLHLELFKAQIVAFLVERVAAAPEGHSWPGKLLVDSSRSIKTGQYDDLESAESDDQF